MNLDRNEVAAIVETPRVLGCPTTTPQQENLNIVLDHAMANVDTALKYVLIVSQRVEQSAAIVTIKDAPSMTKRGRRQIAQWLRRQAGYLERHADKLSKRFTARYCYR